MTTSVSRSTVHAFLDAFASRDMARIESFLHEDVVYLILGPVDVIPFCGEHHGRAAVVALIATIIPKVFIFSRFEPEIVLVDGDRCATLARIIGSSPTGRSICYRTTQFIRFKDNKMIEYWSITDTYDAAEQMLGHPFLPPVEVEEGVDGDVVAV